MHRNIQVHNLEPIGLHIQVDFDDSKVHLAADLIPEPDSQNNWFVEFELVGGNAFITVDGKTDPTANGDVGKPLEVGIPYTLWRTEHRQMKLIAETGATIEFIGQKYYYNELN